MITYASIGGPLGHRTFTVHDGSYRCECGALFRSRASLAAHLSLVALLEAA